MSLHRRVILLVAVSCLFVAPACGPKDEGGNTRVGRENGSTTETAVARKIGFSAMSLTNPFFQEIADTLVEAGKEHNFEFIINDADNKPNEQAKHVESYIAAGVDAIIMNPVDRTALGPAIIKANEAGIPVFTCDLQSIAEGAKVVAHVGTDNLQGGRLAGDAMVEAIGEQGGKVLVVHYKQANSCVLRVDGFTEVINKHNETNPDQKIEIVGEVDGGGSREMGFKSVSDALPGIPDLAGLFAINDPSALGAWRALNDAGKADQIVIVGFDGHIDGKRGILEGKIYADPIQFPKRMARMTVQNIVDYMNGDEVVPVTLIETELYRKADAEKDSELQ